jgi:UTP---glucose-1-phosphate uridylyltransferase
MEVIKNHVLTDLNGHIAKLKPLSRKILSFTSLDEKIKYLAGLENVAAYLLATPWLREYLKDESEDIEYVFLSLLAIDQGPIVLDGYETLKNNELALGKLVKELVLLEGFYSSLGGIIGYHLKVLELMQEHFAGKELETDISYFLPPYIDLAKDTDEIQEAVIQGIKTLEEMAEVYPVGGAGDRLNLTDERTGQPLPAARLHFLGKTLFECLIRDLQAREYLFFKLFGKKLTTPIVLMTSHEKMNDEEIQAICEKANWFGRPKESFFSFMQPSTPVITIDGNWATHGPLDVLTKPGGHGVIWKLAQDQGAFSWLQELQRKYILIRQINNPIAGVDFGLLALCGHGVKEKMAFGFATCPKRKDAAEGVVSLEKSKHKKVITNVEYTELAKSKNKALKDAPFPANTNILFAKIDEMQKAIEILPIPGMLVNMKLAVHVKRPNKEEIELQAARLESTMQNIADALFVDEKEQLKTFVTFNERGKTISVTKKSYEPGGQIIETPEGAFYDVLNANFNLLKDTCKVELTEFGSTDEYLSTGPSHLFLYHPALGPLYSTICQKIHGGRFQKGAELQLEIAEVFMKNLQLTGSLLVQAERVMGKNDESGLLTYSDEVGRLVLENVHVVNAGIDRSATNCYWKQEITRKEAVKIKLLGHSEFFAKDVTFTGDFDITVPHDTRAHAMMGKDGKVEIRYEPLSAPWHWNYTSDERRIILSRQYK